MTVCDFSHRTTCYAEFNGRVRPRGDVRSLTNGVDIDEDEMEIFEHLGIAFGKLGFVVAMIMLGSACATAEDRVVPIKATASSPGNIRTDTCSRPVYPEQ